ncbi:MAG: hypothetical protein MR775_04690 [Erysipelotrichaceae bacterium]|nr:hypothetical protein [Erysipelotrichaceae bacterium]
MMKKILLSIICLLSLGSCSILVTQNSSTSSNDSTSTDISTSSGEDVSSDDSTLVDDSSYEIITSENYQPPISSSFPSEEATSYKVIDNTYSSAFSFKYTTGNYSNQYGVDASINILDIDFQYYRAVQAPDGYLIKMLDLDAALAFSNQLGGALMNVSEINHLANIEITYYNESSSISGGYVRFGKNLTCAYGYELTYSESDITLSFNIPESKYFRIETNGANLVIKSIKLGIAQGNVADDGYGYYTKQEYRINPIKFSGELQSGVSFVDVPTSISVNKNSSTYIVNETKRLTYYDYDYVTSNNLEPSEVSIIDPLEVALYYAAFNKAPVNYNESGSSNHSYFGDYARRISSEYSRTDGYVNALSGITPTDGYIELDIGVNGNYAIRSRGVGRIVVFYSGSSSSGYDNSPLLVYTDDHYATFREFLGYDFSLPFDAQNQRTGNTYKPYNVLSPK